MSYLNAVKHSKEDTIKQEIRLTSYYCGPDFDPRIGQELTAPQFLLRKIMAAKEFKIQLGLIHPIDGVRIRRIAEAIDLWQRQFDEIFYEEKSE